jgi:hypothetical protein
VVLLLSATPPSRTNQDDDVFKKLEQAADRLSLAEAMNELLREKLIAKDDRISAKETEIELLKQQKSELLSATNDRRAAGNLDAERLADAKAIIAKQDAEIARLRNPGFFASLFDKRTIYGFVGGYGGCRLVTSGASATQVIGIPTATQGGAQSQFSLFQTSADQRARLALKAVRLGQQ